MASTTTTFLKSRVSKPTVNKWSSGFTAVKNYAEKNNLPLIAVWTNGDACGLCVNFEKTLMKSEFLNWQKTSGCVFWFGCSNDKTADDKLQGTGFTWTRNSKLTTYPFVRVYWKKGKVDVAKSGNDWTGGGTSGAAKFVKSLKSLLKDFCPNCEDEPAKPEPTDPTPPTCEDGSCGTGSCGDCDCDALKAEIESLKADISALQTKIATFQSAWLQVVEYIDKFDAAVKDLPVAKKSRSTKKKTK